MKLIIKNFVKILAISIIFIAVISAIGQHQVYADTKSQACQGAAIITGSTSSGCEPESANSKGLNDTIAHVINILSFVVAVAAVVMIIIAGVRFATSGGDSNTVNSARNTILYAVVGLVIVALAQIIVKFVLNKVVF